MTPARAVMLRGALALGGVAFAVLVAEVALRVSGLKLGRHTDTMFTVMQHDARFGWLMKPGVEQRVDFVDVERLPIRSNSLGFRDAEFSVMRRAGACRIAYTGDSFTWGLGVTEGERFSTLATRAQPSWESLNFGMPGFGTDQSLLLFEQVVAGYDPDAVVFTLYQNDYVDNTYDIRYGRGKPYLETSGDTLAVRNTPVPTATFYGTGIWNRVAPPYRHLFAQAIQRKSRVVHWIGRNSALARAIYSRLGSTGDAPAAPAAQPVADPSATPPATPPEAPRAARALPIEESGRLELATTILAQLARRVEATGARFVVYLAGSTPIFEHQRRRLDALGIAVGDATTEAIGPEIGGEREVLFPYNGHWTPKAHAAVAKRMAGWLAANACGAGRGR